VLNDNGIILSQTEFLPFGETWTQEGDKKHAPKYNSQELDKESGYYFYNARHYDPEICRFVTGDNIVQNDLDTQSWNRFSYVRNNPVIYKDPTGHIGIIAALGDLLGGGAPEGHSEVGGPGIESLVKGDNSKKDTSALKEVDKSVKDTATNDVAKKLQKPNDKVVKQSTAKNNSDFCDKLATNNGIDLPLADKDKSTYPAYKNGISSDYLAHEKFRKEKGSGPHSGIDMPAAPGTPIYSTVDGKVKAAGPSSGYGNLMIVEDKDGKQYYFGHTSAFSAKPGDPVSKGQKIASVGNTGTSYPPDPKKGFHVHYEIRDKNNNILNPYDQGKKYSDEIKNKK